MQPTYNNLSVGDFFNSSIGKLKIVDSIGKGKSGYSFRASLDNMEVVLKIMHNESVPYYSFTKNKVLLESNAYELLDTLNIKIPRMLCSDIENNYLVKEYVPGITGAEWISKNRSKENIIKQLFEMARILEKNKINIDFFPTNFIINAETLYYIDYEVNNYDAQWDLLNWGIYYWANGEGFKKFMKNGDASAINIDVTKGQPIREPFQEIVNSWISKYK